MNVAIFSDTFVPMNNGVVTHLVELTTHLGKRGHRITLFVAKPANTKNVTFPISDNIKIHYLSSIPFYIYNDYRLSLGLLPQSFKKKAPNIELIHVHTPTTLGINGTYIANKLKIPLVNTFHAYFTTPEYFRVLYLHKIGLGKSAIISKLITSYARWHYNQASVVVVPSENTQNYLQKIGINKPIRVISNGIDLDKISLIKKNSVSDSFDLPLKYFLCVGRISFEKDIDVLIAAFSLFCKSNKDTNLVFVGTGPAKEEIKKLVFQKKIEDRVHFLGQVAHDKLMNSNIYPSATAFVSASKSETQGIGFLEAMAFGIPLIVVGAGGAYELAQKSGIVCQPNDEKSLAEVMAEIVKNQNLHKKLSNGALETVKKHALNKTIDKMEKLYMELIASRSKSV